VCLPVLKSVWCACLATHHSTDMMFVLSPRESRCRLYSGIWTARAHDFSYVLSLAYYPSRTRLLQTKCFCFQALWQCLSLPGKHLPLESLNSIVSACHVPRHLCHKKGCMNGARGHRTVTGGGCQVHEKKMVIPCQEGTLRGRRILGERPCVFRAPQLGKETALHVPWVPNWTPGWGYRTSF
jgi:hypothetical protein